VAASFAAATDPAGETAAATPLFGVGLMIRRATAVLTVAFAVLLIAAVGLRDFGLEASGWILPGLGLALGALALSTWTRVETAVALLAAGWLSTVMTLWWMAKRHSLDVHSSTFAWTTQGTALALSVIAVLVIAARRDRYATLEAFR
jgi:hypothetical protein